LLEIAVLCFQELVSLLWSYCRDTADVAVFVEIERCRDLGKAGVAGAVCEAFGIVQIGTEDLLEVLVGYLRGIQASCNKEDIDQFPV
jgi:hypothetical protein